MRGKRYLQKVRRLSKGVRPVLCSRGAALKWQFYGVTGICSVGVQRLYSSFAFYFNFFPKQDCTI
jgi:hypothetical protein